MAQEMTLSVYLQLRGKKAKALTRVEAEVFGIPFPLLAGWPRRHGAMALTTEMIERVEACITEASHSCSPSKQRSANRVCAARTIVPECENRGDKTAARSAPAIKELRSAPSFPGFALRPARRLRPKVSAPWA